MKFSVQVIRIVTTRTRIEVEADNYSQASTKAMEIAKLMGPEQFDPDPYRKPELRVTSTDKRGP